MIIFLREKFIAQIFMWVIAVVFVIATFLLYSGSSGPQQGGAEGEVVIRIGALEVTRSVFNQLVSQQIEYQQRNQRFNQDVDTKVVEKNLIDGLIKRTIEGSARISDAEVVHYIRSDENLVKYYNQANAERAQQLKDNVRFNLSSTSLRDSIRELELVTDTEAEQSYQLEGDKAKVKYIEFRHSDYTSRVPEAEITAEAEAYYQENKDDYSTEEEVNVKFIQVNPADFVSNEDTEKYYNENQNEFYEPEIPVVKARHILKKFPDDATDEQNDTTDEQNDTTDEQKAETKKAETKKAAEELLKKVNEELAAGTSFEDLAKEYSEGPSGANGGALRGRNPKLPPGDYFARGDMVKPFEEACFDTLNPGEVSGLIETSYGYHIIKLEERKEPTLQTYPDVEGEIRSKLIQIDGVEDAERTANDLVFEIEVEDYETAIGKEKYSELALVVGETGFFGKDDSSIPKIGSKFAYRGLTDELFDMEVGVTDTVETKNYSGDISGFFVVTVLGKKPPTIPNFEDIKVVVEDDLRSEKSKDLALADAQKLFNQRTEDELLDALVKKYKAPEGINTEEKTVAESNQFGLTEKSTYVSGMGDSKDVMFAAFGMSVGDVRGPFNGNSAAYIIELVERVEADLDKFSTDSTLKLKRYQTILTNKKESAYQNWLAAQENGTEIWIHEDFR